MTEYFHNCYSSVKISLNFFLYNCAPSTLSVAKLTFLNLASLGWCHSIVCLLVPQHLIHSVVIQEKVHN